MKYIIIALSILQISNLYSQNYTFNGHGDGTSWEDPDNWDINSVPNGVAYVTISNGFSVDIANGNEFTIQQLILNSGGALTIESNAALSFLSFVGNKGFYPLQIDGHLINNGSIELEDFDHLAFDISSTGKVNNFGQINISKVPDNGASQNPIIKNENLLINESSGQIRFYNIGRYVILNKDTLENRGLIQIDSFFTYGLVNEGYVNNKGRMIMKRLNPISNKSSIWNASNNTDFHNNGLIKFDKIQKGITYSSGIFINEINGKILANDSNSSTVDCANASGSFTNHGLIKSTNGFDGIYVIDGDFINSVTGKIYSTNDARHSFSAISGGTFSNNGNLFATNPGSTGILTTTSSMFTNQGLIEINDPSDYCIDNGPNCTFQNNSCGILILDDTLKNRGNFINQAYIKNSTTGGFALLNEDIFSNTGFIESHSVGNPGQLSSNIGYISEVLSGVTQVGDIIDSILTGPGTNITIINNNLTITDENTSPIGAFYNSGAENWTIKCAASGVGALFHDIQVGSCPVLEVSYVPPVSFFSVPSVSNVTWTGNALDNDWDNLTNWNPMTVPDGCNNVEITSSQVNIPINATAYSIDIKQSILNNLGNLYVHGDHTFGIQMDFSFLNNSGNIHVKMNSGHGLNIFNGAKINQINGSSLIIDDYSNLNTSDAITVTSTDSVFNNGLIEVNDFSPSSTPQIKNQGYFENQNDGDIEINGLFENLLSSGRLQNHGKMTIFTFDHDHGAFLTNEQCGEMILQNVIWRDSAINNGIIRFKEKTISNNIFLADTVTNQGIIEDYHELNTKNKISQNTGVQLLEITDQLGVDFPFPLSFTTGNFIFSDTIYADPELCLPIGAYDDMAKIITPNIDAADAEMICFEIDKTGANCLDTFCISLKFPVRRESCASGSLAEMNYLLTFYDSLDGANWANKTGWLDGKAGTSCDICNWNGVICDATDSYVVGISLFNNNLSGTLPEILSNLDSLKILSLANNNITGTIPNAIGSLQNLEELSLQQNSLSGQLPATLANLTKLRQLNLSLNSFSSTLLSAFSSWVELESINLNSAGFMGEIPDMFGGMTKLKDITFRTNNFSGELPSTMGLSDSLVVLDLLNNNLVGCFPSVWDSLCNNIGLVHQLGGNNIAGQGDLDAFCNTGFGTCHDPNNCGAIGDTLKFIPNNNALQWSGASNWNLNRSPDYCDFVLIEPNKFVTINTLINARCEAIKVESGGALFLDGNLTVDSFLCNEGFFRNTGVLRIDSTNKIPLNNKGIVHNEEGGTINLSAISGAGIYAIHNSPPADEFINKGKIFIYDVADHAIVNESKFETSDSLIINKVMTGHGFWNMDTLIIDTIGVLAIEDLNGNFSVGLLNKNGAFIDDLGKIVITDVQNIGIHNMGEFLIKSNGTIETSNISKEPIILDINSIYDCQGTMDIKN